MLTKQRELVDETNSKTFILKTMSSKGGYEPFTIYKSKNITAEIACSLKKNIPSQF